MNDSAVQSEFSLSATLTFAVGLVLVIGLAISLYKRRRK
ncbi:LPXTG cell wall anchor domain-containing protein [Cohnella faecalis]|uniref:LPXTG cell wall anchor domain-containing protein n=1 Tax=Cohnella faecalis TaxID=2315694 RepID=A0A398CUA1_9BACL|nr:LPXTG cell wall anchor domain-containing protein [Cohnella faecalis]RIE03427.1 LPXTG cell wall anchor domain-containing protein [Cohnella faecalis]